MTSVVDLFPPGTDLNTIPLEEAPYPLHSDFVKRSDLLTLTIFVVALLLSLLTILLGLRVYTKLGRDKKWQWDDC
jgi:hypothetical protein